MHTPGTIDTRELLHHGDWIRSLARALARDPHAAADLEQEAWLAALKHGPSRDTNVRGWFATVLRNAARMQSRSASRRVAREGAVARREALPSTAELVAEASLHERLVQLVLALDEPERSTLLLHFFKDLSLSEIARKQGEPVSTVHARVRRGVAKLRRRLDHAFGAGAWAGAIEHLAHEPAPAGWFARAFATKSGKLAALAVVGLAGWFVARAWLTSDVRSAQTLQLEKPFAVAPAMVRRARGEALAEPVVEVAPQRGASSPSVEAESVSAPRPRPTPLGVHGSLLDEQREPLGYGRIAARVGGKTFATADVLQDGTFSFGTLPPDTYDLLVDEAPAGYLAPFAQDSWSLPVVDGAGPRHFATELVVANERSTHVVGLTAFRRARILGFVGDATWRGLPNVRLRLQCVVAGLELLAIERTTAHDGTFEFRELYPSTYRLEVLITPEEALAGTVAPLPKLVTLEGGEREDVDLVFASTSMPVVGRVVGKFGPSATLEVWAVAALRGAPTGKPVSPENLVAITRTSNDGYFEFPSLPEGPISVFALHSTGESSGGCGRAWSESVQIEPSAQGQPLDVGVLRVDREAAKWIEVRFDEDSTRLPQSRKPIRASKYLRSQSDRISLISPFLKQSPAAEVVSRQTARFATGGAIFSSLYIDQGRRPPLFEWLIFPVRDLEQSTIHVR
ncbi:MAG: sigma-70 family RNA polymerase sigma factor [Planctomycetes bacterium]|nr:sigma-70 family RNA polymerase sigma factor [Planctomycetota bacterium]